ncbi:LOW QUALITY PROTEIN: hypothetical protein KUTeg_008809 [Tegillarca granosa]|uniref:Uncharacterized protein n=1 Tax=Tegillarca granosa TaxID=220873 RepID=A0ABQ9FF09_TEGGR|nr:LOW QUALITY PROTEIN: hypothetical protein KUTeg_008809 [Tegillarca granosa]
MLNMELKDHDVQKVPLTSYTVKQEDGDGHTVNQKQEENNKKTENKEEEHGMVGVIEIFKYSTALDKLFMIIGSIAASGNGAALPCMLIVFGEMIDVFVTSASYYYILDLVPAFLKSLNTTKEAVILNPDILKPFVSNLESNLTGIVKDNTTLNEYMEIINIQLKFDLMEEMKKYSIYYAAIGCGVLILGYLQITCWVTAAERQSHTIRKKFFRNILRQGIGWFDTHESGEIINRLSDDINKVHAGIGDKVGVSIQWFATFTTGFIIGFVYGWKLTLVIVSVSPILAGVGFLMNRIISAFAAKELSAYAKAGAVAEEVLGAIRTVVAFGGQEKECKRYKDKLKEAKKFGIKKGLSNGLSLGAFYMVMYGAYALGFWYGCKLVFFSALMGAFALGHAAPGLQVFASARSAARILFKLIDQTPDIDSSSDEGIKPDYFNGEVEFVNVHFTYPARQEVKILNGVDLKAQQGTMVALVGSSGCGKSTIMQLLQRFYDPQEGKVLIDGNDIKEVNLKWLREHIGIVGQEPILFATTIGENIRYGRDGVTQEQIEQAAKMANAHDFIMMLPDKYETLVGDRGAQLSGGQKQRVAIARALVRDPKILLLDEATSALDTESESIVQDALDKAKNGRTTIVIAHRLSTIRAADKIAGFKKGVVVEIGSHDELMANKEGVYSALVNLQSATHDDEEFEMISKYTSKERRIEFKTQSSVKSVKSDITEPATAITPTKDSPRQKGKETPNAPLTRILSMNSPEWLWILIGCVCALINGGMEPVFAIIFSEIIIVFAETDEVKQEQQVQLFAGVFVGIGILSFVTYTVQSYLFGKSGEMLTFRLRELSFKAMLRQEISWFDDQKNSTGILTSRLATDASQVQAGSGVRIGTFVQALGNLGTGIILSLIWGWKLALVVIAFLPLIAVAAICEMKITDGVAGKNKEALEDAFKVATEAIENIKNGLKKEGRFCELYNSHLTGPYKTALKRANTIGLAYSVSQGVYYFAFSASFYFGAYLILHNEMTFDQVIKVFSAIAFGGYAAGQATTFAPDAAKASMSAGYIFRLLDRKPPIDTESEEGLKLDPERFTSTINFDKVFFRYPTRPDIQILQGLSLFVQPGQTLALVEAGCGKSTAVQLVERFYDPEDGDVTLDNYDIREFNIQWLRSQISIVSQEPILFDCSIAQNIAYGDNSRVVPMEEIIKAARNANIHQFIESLPLGYNTNVGERGTQLSGGQKQRVAIARSLVRNPKILLLDEATSALDTENKICVLKKGQVYEEGTHTDLMAKQGLYFKLQAAQHRQKQQ